MTSIDLTEAVEAAAAARWDSAGERKWDTLTPIAQHQFREAILDIVAAAAPVIEAQVRAQVAADLVAVANERYPDNGEDIRGRIHRALKFAADRARGDL